MACYAAWHAATHPKKSRIIPEYVPETKTCSGCAVAKPLNQFNRSPRYTLGVTGQCKECRQAAIAKWSVAAADKPKVIPVSKTCLRCKQEKPIDAFPKLASSKDGHRSRCKPCRIEAEYRGLNAIERRIISITHYMKRRYGITAEDYYSMLASQKGKCAVCDEHMKKPNVDHCHATAKVRGLICTGCNTLVGFVEKPGQLEKALAYLEKTRQK